MAVVLLWQGTIRQGQKASIDFLPDPDGRSATESRFSQRMQERTIRGMTISLFLSGMPVKALKLKHQ
jgi:hypothetical protein